MKTAACLVSIVLILLSTACFAEQSMGVKLAFRSWLSDDELTFGETGYAYNHGGLALEGMIHFPVLSYFP